MQRKYLTRQRQFLIGILIISVMAAAFLSVFLNLARTDKVDTYLSSALPQSKWKYEVLRDGKTETLDPEFNEDLHLGLSGNVQAVRLTRTMTETMRYAELEVMLFTGEALEVFLDDDLLYASVSGNVRNQDGFLILDKEDIEKTAPKAEEYPGLKSIRMSLPGNYTGRELKIITYYAEKQDAYFPSYPYLGSMESRYAQNVADTVMPVAGLVLCAICVLVLTMVFVLGTFSGRPDLKVLLLILYFIFVFINNLNGPNLSIVAETEEHRVLEVLAQWEVLPLYVYLALFLTGRRRWFAFGSMAVWTAVTGMEMVSSIRETGYILADPDGKEICVLTLALMAMFAVEFLFFRRKEINRQKLLSHAGIAAAVSILCIIYEANRTWNGSVADAVRFTFLMLAEGYCITLVVFLENVYSSMAVILLVLGFLRRNEETRTLVTVLEERGRAAMNGYDRMLDAEEATNSLRHEMAHHMTALMGLIREGESRRAENYISSVVKELNELPVFRYSENILVNMIAGTYLERARKMGIQVTSSFCVPGHLDIRDEDLSVFLTNMLQNALEACERIPSEEKRFISVKMRMQDNFLSISCANSRGPEAPSDAENNGRGKDRSHEKDHRHGYGLKAMTNIAEKYGSLLKIDQTSAEFSVKTSLYLTGGPETC